MQPIVGLLLAAGEGRRMGAPKALVRDPTGAPWVVRTVRVLHEAGIADVVVVVGAAADDVGEALAGEDVRVVYAASWADGMGASLAAGLRHVAHVTHVAGLGGEGPPRLTAVLVALVDTPGLNADVVRRMSAHAAPDVLARAAYGGVPGHPVLLGATHVGPVLDHAGGDVGARDYLRLHPPMEVECGDLAAGADVDTPEDLPPGHSLG